MKQNIISIILAGGKGTRFNSKTINKVALPFLGKPLITYGVELLQPVSSQLITVVGSFEKSVKDLFKNHSPHWTYQKERLGTGHAVKIALQTIREKSLRPQLILIGYGDHLMFYETKTISRLINLHKKDNASVSIITTIHHNPSKEALGRIIRNTNNQVTQIIEHKEATEKQHQIKEINAGFYCLDYEFAKENIDKIKKSHLTGEYYLTDIIKIAIAQKKKVSALNVPFEKVGIGINTKEELEEAEELYKKVYQTSHKNPIT